MKQLLQSPRTGETVVADVPVPAVELGSVLVRTSASLVSAGTERMMVQFAEKSLIAKALARPDLVRQVVDKVRRDGLLATLNVVRDRLDQPMPLGYSAVGRVLEVGAEVTEFTPGARVACAGAGFANHAEFVSVPQTLCVPVPGAVPDEEAVFATLGAIALHGVRLADLRLGEFVVVIGLGLLGQPTAQLARAAGCRVVGVDLLADRNDLARRLGADLAVTPDAADETVRAWSNGHGADAVLITADAPGNEPIELAGTVARDRAVVVAVGAVGMAIPRRTFYGKELRFLVSRSYGPGRYDPSYEIDGHDYPIGYVRWTERRNLSAFLDLVAAGQVRVAPLITHRFAIESAPQAYEVITGKRAGPYLGVVLTYPGEAPVDRVVRLAPERRVTAEPRQTRLGVLGAGSFASATLLPALKEAGATFVGIASRQGLTARTCGRRFGFGYCTTDERQILEDASVSAIVVATRHNLHAAQALASREAGKHVFVEKPLCLTADELDRIARGFAEPDAPILMVGFNRRFAPLAQTMAEFLSGVREPLVAHYRVNAGFVPPDHWVQDPRVGGGRILGEVCHFVDFLGWLFRDRPSAVSAHALPDSGRYRGDNVVISLRYPNGCAGTITYVACGARDLGKERVEVHGGGRSAVLEDFRRLELFRGGTRRVHRSRLGQDKGHRAECVAFVRAIEQGTGSPIPLADLVATTRATIVAAECARTGRTDAVTL